MTNKAAILASYRAMVAQYPWASDTAKLERFMRAAANTLTPGAHPGEPDIDRTGHSWLCALEQNGLFQKKMQTLKFLRALPEA